MWENAQAKDAFRNRFPQARKPQAKTDAGILGFICCIRLNYRLCSSQSAYEARLEVIEEKDSTDF
jgi:hypothetical protein